MNEIQWQVWARFEVASVAAKRNQERLDSSGRAGLRDDAAIPNIHLQLKVAANTKRSLPPSKTEDIDAFIKAADWTQTQFLAAEDSEDPEADLAAWRDAIRARLDEQVANAQADVHLSQQRAEAAGAGPVVLLSGEHANERAEEWRTMSAPWRNGYGRTSTLRRRWRFEATGEPLHDLLKGGRHAVVFVDGTADQARPGTTSRPHPRG